jgi:hypothetical protein
MACVTTISFYSPGKSLARASKSRRGMKMRGPKLNNEVYGLPDEQTFP